MKNADKTQHEIVDNFLPSDVLNEMQTLLLYPVLNEQILTWTYIPSVKNITDKGKEDPKLFYLAHLIYDHTILSPFHNKIIPHFHEPLDIKSLIRIKINMYPNTQSVQEHGMHIDYKFSHKAGILSINTCDGYTKLEDGTKVDSVANRMLLFDASKEHSSSTCTNQPVRMNINFNYF